MKASVDRSTFWANKFYLLRFLRNRGAKKNQGGYRCKLEGTYLAR